MECSPMTNCKVIKQCNYSLQQSMKSILYALLATLSLDGLHAAVGRRTGKLHSVMLNPVYTMQPNGLRRVYAALRKSDWPYFSEGRTHYSRGQ